MSSKALLANICSVLEESFKKKLPHQIEIIEITKEKSQALNFWYRKKNKPANVLSFRYSNDYGEILLCTEVIRREAREARNPQEYQFAWMIVHGMIHLAGMHHEESLRLAKWAEGLEQRILDRMFAT